MSATMKSKNEPSEPEGLPLWTGETAGSWLTSQVERGVLRPCRALVLAADLAPEAVALSRSGFHVIAVDTDRTALKRARELVRSQGGDLDTVHGDLFRLKPSFYGPVELIYDRTFFASLEVVQRAAWTHITGRILPRHGRLAGLFRIGRSNTGPPYSISVEDLRHSFRNLFTVEVLESAGRHAPGESPIYRGLFRRN
jgi:hypothetical protein